MCKVLSGIQESPIESGLSYEISVEVRRGEFCELVRSDWRRPTGILTHSYPHGGKNVIEETGERCNENWSWRGCTPLQYTFEAPAPCLASRYANNISIHRGYRYTCPSSHLPDRVVLRTYFIGCTLCIDAQASMHRCSIVSMLEQWFLHCFPRETLLKTSLSHSLTHVTRRNPGHTDDPFGRTLNCSPVTFARFLMQRVRQFFPNKIPPYTPLRAHRYAPTCTLVLRMRARDKCKEPRLMADSQ